MSTAAPTSKTKREVVDERWMGVALELAHRAKDAGLRPFGCVVVDWYTKQPLAMAYGSEQHDDPTRHSELVAIRDASLRRNALLQGCSLYSTHEPCTMCCGGICHAKLSRVVFGSYRSDMPELFREKQHNSFALLCDTTTPVEVVGGVLRQRCVALFDEERNA